jgi:hypothetical protein
MNRNFIVKLENGLKKGENGRKWLGMVENGWEWVEVVKKREKWL